MRKHSGLILLASFALLLRVAARDITFFHVSDTHYGKNEAGDRALAALVEKINDLPGKAYPKKIGGVVDRPRGVIHTGDCTDAGKAEQWQSFLRDYGLAGGDGRLKWPVYETFGNHDGGKALPVRNAIRERNGTRAGVSAVSSNGLHYAWEWDGVRFIQCGINPGFETRTYDPENSLPFLQSVLAKTNGPVVLLHHFGFDEGHSLKWWKEDVREAYRSAIEGSDVLGILHGHAHRTMIYKWSGYDVYHPPHFRQAHAPTGTVTHGFFVFHITDKELTVAERLLDDSWGMTARKSIKP